jgi:Tfp pilus assembly protein PilV
MLIQGTKIRRTSASSVESHEGAEWRNSHRSCLIPSSLTPCLRASVPQSLSKHRGFSFAEVMFAVIILGIGFIMIAGLFPVAISQSKATSDETSAAAFARVASNYSGMMGNNANMVPSYASDVLVPQVLALPSSTGDTALVDPSNRSAAT